MAQSLIALPSETVFAECRAFVFFYDVQLNRWSEVGESNSCSRIQLLCRRPPGSNGIYRIFGRLEATGMITINLQLADSVTYVVSNPSWHQIRVHVSLIYGLRVSPESDGMKFSIIVQNTLRSLQGTRNLPLDHMGNWGAPPEPIPTGQNMPSASPAGAPKTPEPPSRDGGGVQKKREMYDARIDALCGNLSDAIRNGLQENAVELVKQFAHQKLPLSIKLKNPVLVTMDSGADTINIRVVVEDKQSSGGAFSMKVSPSSTIERLQKEVFDRYSFPVQVQKWIIGKKVPKPTDTLRELNVRQSGHTLFLYLLSGKTVGLRRSDAERHGRSNGAPTSSSANAAASNSSVGGRVTQATTTASPPQLRRATSTPTLSGQGESQASSAASRTDRLPPVSDSPPVSLPNHDNTSGPATLPAHVQPGMTIDQLRNILNRQWGSQGDVRSAPNLPSQEAFVNNLIAAEQPAEEDGPPVGWQCAACTFINPPTRPGCEMCSADRPEGYVVPDGAMLDERERSRLAAEERSEALFQQDVERQLVMGLQQSRLQETE